MKMRLFILGIGLLGYGVATAQETGVIRIKGGAKGEKEVIFSRRYRFDQFLPGQVIYYNGTPGSARLNYNILLSEMQFIDSHGDTLALANELTIRQVGVGSAVFYYDQAKGYLEIIADYRTVKLAEKQGLRLAKNEKQGGYEQSTGTSAITTYQSYSSGSTSVRKLEPTGDLLLIKNRTYFIIDQNSRAFPANKNSLLKIFGKHREQIMEYLAGETVDFKQVDDLRKVLRYCSDLL